MNNHIDKLFEKEESKSYTSISFRALPEEREALKKIAKILGKPIHEIVRNCYMQGMDVLKEKVRAMNGG